MTLRREPRCRPEAGPLLFWPGIESAIAIRSASAPGGILPLQRVPAHLSGHDLRRRAGHGKGDAR